MMTEAFDVELQTVRSGFDGQTCWVDPWAGVRPDGRCVLTMQKLLLSGSDVFFGPCAAWSDDRGRTFSPLEPVAGMGRRDEGDGLQSCVTDLKPHWNAPGGSTLGLGGRVFYSDDRHPVHVHGHGRQPEPIYAVCDLDTRSWSEPRRLELPEALASGKAVPGSAQRLDLEDGRILVPLACHPQGTIVHSTLVVECTFDGQMLTARRFGNALSVPVVRGLLEPSIAAAGGRYVLTLRNDEKGYVAASDDGLHFDEPRPWCFDDGEELGSYNTQQHWITHDGRAWLVYTRRGLDNDHVFRHRAPLMIAEIDVERLVVIRETEQVLVPERGARLGNFGVTVVDEGESWVTAAEWMQPVGCESRGSDNSVYIARLRWR